MAKKVDPFAHVVDSDHFEIFETAGLVIHLPNITLFGHEVPTKFLLLITVCALGVGLAMIWLGRKMKDGDTPKGYLWNLFESLLFFVRDKIARPGIGEHDADKFLPYLATLFLFIFSMNLIGMLPFMSSPTAAITVTGALAFVSFLVIHVSGVKENGFDGYLKTFIPHIHLDGGPAMQLMGKLIVVGMAVLEYATAFIRAGVLAVRLFANMLAGHTVLFMILFFISLVAHPDYQIEVAKGKDWMLFGVAPFSVALVTALSLLELFIAGLQAFVFTFLTAVFIADSPSTRLTEIKPGTILNQLFGVKAMMRLIQLLGVAMIVVLASASPLFAVEGAGIGGGIGMGLAVVGIGLGIGIVGYAALSGIARQPEQAGAIQGAMFILAGLIEGAGIIALVLCLVLAIL